MISALFYTFIYYYRLPLRHVSSIIYIIFYNEFQCLHIPCQMLASSNIIVVMQRKQRLVTIKCPKCQKKCSQISSNSDNHQNQRYVVSVNKVYVESILRFIYYICSTKIVSSVCFASFTQRARTLLGSQVGCMVRTYCMKAMRVQGAETPS